MALETLQQLADTGQTDRFLMEKTADAIADVHRRAAHGEPPEPGSSQSLTDLQDPMARRRRAGCVRSCHGDLRLPNIALSDDQIVFLNPVAADGGGVPLDVIEDIAVLLGELEKEGLREAQNILFNRYFDVTGGVIDDPDTLSALHRLLPGKTSPEPSPLRLVAVGGLSGGGKSRMSRKLAPLFPCPGGARVVRTDVVRKRMMGVALSERLPSHGYTEDHNRQTYERFYQELSMALAQGHSVIADGVFAVPEQRRQVQAIAESHGVPFCGLWVNAPVEVREQRVKARLNNVSDVTPAVIQRQLEFDLGTITWQQIDSS